MYHQMYIATCYFSNQFQLMHKHNHRYYQNQVYYTICYSMVTVLLDKVLYTILYIKYSLSKQQHNTILTIYYYLYQQNTAHMEIKFDIQEHTIVVESSNIQIVTIKKHSFQLSKLTVLKVYKEGILILGLTNQQICIPILFNSTKNQKKIDQNRFKVQLHTFKYFHASATYKHMSISVILVLYIIPCQYKYICIFLRPKFYSKIHKI
eukprot:TRINITY_DN49985_c0_g1_i1.p3 TRINITY_DN49985_c0_g1~~TRINITY_DN49985_c0_g1_i1.p3  ORF type:complete len:207 (-),score=-36.01 TRINITY_DN49985_c0_g1_i1:169-789(-)